MRVLYLTMNPNRASTTVATEGWFRYLRPRGLEPVLASDRAGSFHQWCAGQGIPAYEVGLPPPRKARPLPFLRSLWRLRRLVSRHSIQLIHCNEQDIYPIGQCLGRLCGLPVVVSVHFTMDRGFCDWAFGGARQPRRIFFVSYASQEACRSAIKGIVPEWKWSVLYNGLDMDSYRPDTVRRERLRGELGIGPDTSVLGVACALRPRKQLEHLFEAFARLGARDTRLLVAGGPVPGDEDYAGRLIDGARRRLGERFVYLGHLDDLRDFCNALDIFVNTSREESFGIGALEALACGCPVVGYPSTSVGEVILPGGGEIVEQDRIDPLIEALDRWLSDLDRLAAARPDARGRAEGRFELRGLSHQLWEEYRGILDGPRPAVAAAPSMSNSR